MAYRALFNSLTEKKFPENMNHETLSMLYASISQLLNETGAENTEDVAALRECFRRCSASTETKKKVSIP